MLETNTHIFDSLEKLIRKDFKRHYPTLKTTIDNWYNNGAYDANYYYRLLAYLPFDNPIRKKFLGNFSELVKSDSWGWNREARLSLINVQDRRFCIFYGQHLNRKIEKNQRNNKNLEKIVEQLMELGENAYRLIISSNLKIIKKFIMKSLEYDKKIALKRLDGHRFDEEDRVLWICDKVAPLAIILKFDDILEYLKNEAWYWHFLFHDEYGYENEENINLLSWNRIYTNDILEKRLAYLK